MSLQHKLTAPQRRILTDAVRDGKTTVGGRNIPAINNLENYGLITAGWGLEEGGQQTRFRIVVRPTDAGKDLIYGH